MAARELAVGKALTAGQEACAPGDGVADVLLGLVDRLVVDHGAHDDAGTVTGADRHLRHLLDEAADELVVDARLDVDPVRTDAGLAGVAELRGDDPVDGLVEVGVVEDDVRGVAPELERQPCDVPCRHLDQLLADLGGAGERDLAHARVAEERLPDHARASRGDEVHNPGRDAGVLDAAEDEGRRQGGLRGGLDDTRAAGGEGRAELARHHRRREVPGGDRGGHADGLPEDEDAVLGVLRRDDLAVDALGLAREPLEEARRVLDLALGLVERLALLGGHHRADVLDALAHDRCGPHHQPGAVAGRRRSPAGKGGRSCVDRPLDVLARRVRHRADHIARRRVRDVEALARCSLDPLSTDQQLLVDARDDRHVVPSLAMSPRLAAPA